jgi:hypothetical protein
LRCRAKAYLKVNTIIDSRPWTPDPDKGVAMPPDTPEYVCSDYLYFKVGKYVALQVLNPDGTPQE